MLNRNFNSIDDSPGMEILICSSPELDIKKPIDTHIRGWVLI